MDIALRFDRNTGQFDLAIEGGDLGTDEGLQTAVILSLFTDRRALPEDELPGGGSDRRGWWADAFRARRHGSRLWLLGREKAMEDVRRRAEEYAREALRWLIDDRVAAELEIDAEHLSSTTLGLNIRIRRGDGSEVQTRYSYVWR
jgi:phage gp46-like protein